MSEKNGVMDLVRFMLCSHTSFVEKRIADAKYRKVFKDTALCLISISSKFTDSNTQEVFDFKGEVELIKRSIELDKPNFFKAFFNEEHTYRLLAVEMVEDIVSSAISRFVNGDSKAYLELFDVKFEIS